MYLNKAVDILDRMEYPGDSWEELSTLTRAEVVQIPPEVNMGAYDSKPDTSHRSLLLVDRGRPRSQIWSIVMYGAR